MARDFSILGYSPEHLTSMDKLVGLFESWISKHGKTYKRIEEKLHRFEVFRDNLKHIDQRNKEIGSYWLGLNEFADLTHQEFKNKYLGLKPELTRKMQTNYADFTYRDVNQIPKSVDWRTKGAVTLVKNQGPCGTFWIDFIFLSRFLFFFFSKHKNQDDHEQVLQVAVGLSPPLQLLKA